MFYELEYDDRYPCLWNNNSVRQYTSIFCTKYPEHQRGRRSAWSLSLIQKNKNLPDFCNTFYSDWIIKDHVAEKLKGSGFTGFDLRPVDLKNNRTGGPVWELFVTGKGGEAHPSSGIVKIRECPYCGNTQYRAFTNGIGIIVDENNWDGCDFFTITAYPKFVLVTERVMEFIAEQHWSGVKLTPSTELINRYLGNGEVSPF